MIEAKILNRVREHYDYAKSCGYNVIAIMLQGSQNYNLHTDLSDVDTKAIVVPKFNDFVRNNHPISTTLVLENNEHIDLKDIRVMFDNFLKSNINFTEILFTEYKIIDGEYENLLQPLFDNCEKIATYNLSQLFNSISGMSMQKFVALKHPYPTLIDKIAKYGIDPKQLHHIVRLNEFIHRIANGEKFSDSLISKNTQELIDIKYGKYTFEVAEDIAKKYNDETKSFKDYLLTNNEHQINNCVVELLNEIKYNVLKYCFKKELFSE